MKKGGFSKKDILVFLRKNKDFFKKEFDVDEIMLFGSYARGEETRESDIDILIKSETKSYDKSYGLKVFLEDNLGKKVDVVYFDAVHPFIMRFIREELVYA